MASTTMGVRVSDDERGWIEGYAMFTGRSVSEVIREAVFEMIEDAIDLYEYDQAMLDRDGENIPFEQVVKEVLAAQ